LTVSHQPETQQQQQQQQQQHTDSNKTGITTTLFVLKIKNAP
jgi:hypothetical protein